MIISPWLQTTDINAYSDAGAERKDKFHSEGKKFLRALAKELGMGKDYDLSSCRAGIAVSGEVILHSDQLYVQLAEGWSGEGPQILFRSCKGRKDYCGDTNNFVLMRRLAESETAQEEFIMRCKRLIATARAAAQPA